MHSLTCSMKLTLTVIVRVVKSSTSAAVRRSDRSKKYLCIAEIQHRILSGQVGQIRNNV